ncbi:hypothetical protein ACSBR2_008963 [Camellia fascicularis]
MDRINNCNLIDLGSVGPRLTWTNNRQGLANSIERLDRAMSNHQWRALFPEGTVRTLPRTYSDHSPLVVYTQDLAMSILESYPNLADKRQEKGMTALNLLASKPFSFRSTWFANMSSMSFVPWQTETITLLGL